MVYLRLLLFVGALVGIGIAGIGALSPTALAQTCPPSCEAPETP